MNFLTINGHSIHYQYQSSETGCIFVFANSLGTDLRIWDGVVERLQQKGSMLRFDIPGHGLSPSSHVSLTIHDYAALVIGMLDILKIEKCVFVGLSIGGLIGQLLAIQYPERIDRLILSNTAQKIGDAAQWNTRIDAVRQKGMTGVADMIVERWLSATFQTVHKIETMGLRRMLESTSPEDYINACEAIRDLPFIENIRQITLPVLCIGGEADVATTPDMIKKMANAVPGAHLTIIEGVSHLPCVEVPATVARLIVDFVEENDTSISPDISLYEQGMRTRRSVLGDVYVDRAEAAKTDFDSDFQLYITQQAWGAVWSRPHLTQRERSMLTIALLTALNHHEELAMHIRATNRTGASQEDVKEVLLHTAVYAGVPSVNGAFKLAKEIFSNAE